MSTTYVEEPEYLQQLVADAGPQPDEFIALQAELDAAGGEIAHLTALLAERDAEIARAYWIGDESSPDGRIYCRGCGRSRATRLFRAHADVCWVGAALAARGGERITT